MDEEKPYDEQPHGLCVPGIDEYATSLGTWGSTVDELLVSLEEETCSSLPLGVMVVGALQAQVLRSLVTMSRAAEVLELGTFTGYSAIAMASTGANVTTIDNWSDVAESKALCQKYFERFDNLKGTQADQCLGNIRSLEGNCRDVLEVLAAEGKSFDFVFMDADKEGQIDYYEALLRDDHPSGRPLLSAPHGVLCVDNVLWYGKAATTDKATWDKTTSCTHAFNKHVSEDSRTDVSILTVRDGLSLVTWSRSPRAE